MKDKVVFITGGNSGIGLATAMAFAKEGVHVAIISRREDRNQEAKNMIEKVGVQCLTFAADVSDEKSVKEALDVTFQQYGQLNYAFNNAAIEGVAGPLCDKTVENFDEVMNINVKGVWLALKHQMPYLLKSGGGSIVNTASIAGIMGFPGAELYVASKHAVIGLTKSVAAEFAKENIRVNAISPAGVVTDMYKRFLGDEENQRAFNQKHAMGRSGQPEEIAEAVLWLCSDKSSFVTGENLVLDGGFTISK